MKQLGLDERGIQHKKARQIKAKSDNITDMTTGESCNLTTTKQDRVLKLCRYDNDSIWISVMIKVNFYQNSCHLEGLQKDIMKKSDLGTGKARSPLDNLKVYSVL
jgi:hypothetical protein